MDDKPTKMQRRYLSYLLRLWRETAGDLPGGDPPLWRASLERPQGGERLSFASMVDLFAFLDKETGSGSPGPERSDDEKCQRPATPE
jgi:hypothetical protein